MSVLLHVGVRASDLGRSLRFWRDGLGLRVVRQREGRYDLTDGYLHVGVGVTDVAAAARRLQAMGYMIYSDGLGGKQPLDATHLAERAFKVEDPDGITVDVSGVGTTWPGATLHLNSQIREAAAR